MKMAEPSTGEAQSSIFRAEDIRVMLNNYYIRIALSIKIIEQDSKKYRTAADVKK